MRHLHDAATTQSISGILYTAKGIEWHSEIFHKDLTRRDSKFLGGSGDWGHRPPVKLFTKKGQVVSYCHIHLDRRQWVVVWGSLPLVSSQRQGGYGQAAVSKGTQDVAWCSECEPCRVSRMLLRIQNSERDEETPINCVNIAGVERTMTNF